MSLVNTWCFTKTSFNWGKFVQATHNKYKVVGSRPYTDKKGVLPDGVTLTIQVIHDDFDYGVNKSGKPRENNELQNFDVTILNSKVVAKKGDIVELSGFDEEHSTVVNFDIYLKFKDAKVISSHQPAQNMAIHNASKTII